MNSTRITSVTLQDPRASDIGVFPLKAVPVDAPYIKPGAAQGSLNIGSVSIIVGGCTVTPDDARRQATAMEAIAAHAQDVADQLLAWADQVEDAQSEAGCSCGLRGLSADVDEHPCAFPDDDVDERVTAANDGFLDNADPDMDAAGADDYLAETPA